MTITSEISKAFEKYAKYVRLQIYPSFFPNFVKNNGSNDNKPFKPEWLHLPILKVGLSFFSFRYS